MTKNKTATEKTNYKTAWRNAPAWVRREVNRLEKMAALGGSSSAAMFERQAQQLKEKYVYPYCHGGL